MTIDDPPAVGRLLRDATTIDRSPGAGRRRAVLRRLEEAGRQLPVRTLVGHIADRERDRTLASTELERRQRIHASLCLTHLPALEERGLLEYDRERGLVSRGERFEAVVGRGE